MMLDIIIWKSVYFPPYMISIYIHLYFCMLQLNFMNINQVMN